MSERLFRVCTIFNNAQQYDAMRSSFERAGFLERRAVFENFDNTTRNVHEPFATFNRVLETATEPYIVFCHQDVLADRGDNCDTLLERIAEMNRCRPNWAVLGNGGMDADFRLVRCVCDPHGVSRDLPLPRRVVSLDENFLIVNRQSGIRFSKTLNGFHFYGLDICLNAYKKQRSCFVINFQITHFSSGFADKEFRRKEKEFQDYWSRQFAFFYAASPCTTLFLSRYFPLTWFFRKGKVRKFLLRRHRRRLRQLVEKFIAVP